MQVVKKSIRWRGEESASLEHLVVDTVGTGMVLDAVVITGASPQAHEAVRYRLYADDAGRTRRLQVQRVGEAQSLSLKSDGQGTWTSEDGTRLAQLEGALDVDLPVTPATNALPIRRLSLCAGQSAEIEVAYINWPDLSVRRDPQRYTRLGPDRYLFESLDGSFHREITVDSEGFVIAYPGLFQRI